MKIITCYLNKRQGETEITMQRLPEKLQMAHELLLKKRYEKYKAMSLQCCLQKMKSVLIPLRHQDTKTLTDVKSTLLKINYYNYGHFNISLFSRNFMQNSIW